MTIRERKERLPRRRRPQKRQPGNQCICQQTRVSCMSACGARRFRERRRRGCSALCPCVCFVVFRSCCLHCTCLRPHPAFKGKGREQRQPPRALHTKASQTATLRLDSLGIFKTRCRTCHEIMMVDGRRKYKQSFASFERRNIARIPLWSAWF